MSLFYFHKQNKLARELAESTGLHAFSFTNRGELELKLQGMIANLGYDLWPTFHTVISNISVTLDKYIPLDPDNQLDAQALKVIKNKQPWCFVRVANGPQMSTVVGYTSISSSSPTGMGVTQMAQRGIIRASYVPGSA